MFSLRQRETPPAVRLNAKGRPFMTGEENRVRQHNAYHGIDGVRARYRRAVFAKRQAQMEALFGVSPGGSFLARFWQTMVQFVVQMTPTVIRLRRERRIAQEVKHRFSRTKYGNPVIGRRSFNQRKAG